MKCSRRDKHLPHWHVLGTCLGEGTLMTSPQEENEVKRTAMEWCRLKKVSILDWDGWRYQDGVDIATPITEDEFDKRLSECTYRDDDLDAAVLPKFPQPTEGPEYHTDYKFWQERHKDDPHVRACGISKHEHGMECHRNCSTCYDQKTDRPKFPEPDAIVTPPLRPAMPDPVSPYSRPTRYQIEEILAAGSRQYERLASLAADLRFRLDQDEEVAQAWSDDGKWGMNTSHGMWMDPLGRPIYSPKRRVLADINAKRALIQRCLDGRFPMDEAINTLRDMRDVYLAGI